MLGYLLAWPGMDPEAFLCTTNAGVHAPLLSEWTAAGLKLTRALCVFFALFWTLRLLVATFVFDMRPYLTTWERRVGYQALNAVFLYLPLVYALAAIQPGFVSVSEEEVSIHACS